MKPSDVEALGVILARIKALGMIQNEAEKRAKLPQGRITKWKEGKGELLLRQLTPLADVLDISIDEIAGRAAPKPQTPDEVLLWRIIRRAGAARVLQIVLDALPPAKVDGPDAADNSTSTPA